MNTENVPRKPVWFLLCLGLCLLWQPDVEAAVSIQSLATYWQRRPIRGLRHQILVKALRAYRCARRKRQTRRALLTVIDYSKPSDQKRLWVLDLRRKKVLFREWVAHGSNTGGRWATRFSNRKQSRQTSLGVFLTAGTYHGKHGFSLRLKGLERDFNHHAMTRAIVMHGAWYVSASFIRKHQRTGRSWGCPAVRRGISRKLIQRIKQGTILFAYHDGRRGRSAYTKRWLQRSRYLRCR